jgi:hypothetical protein
MAYLAAMPSALILPEHLRHNGACWSRLPEPRRGHLFCGRPVAEAARGGYL